MTDNRFRVINLFQVSGFRFQGSGFRFPGFSLKSIFIPLPINQFTILYKLTSPGGEYRARTDDPPDTNRDALSLSELIWFPFIPVITTRSPYLVENIGLEPMTPCVQGRCSKPTELIPRLFSFLIHTNTRL